MQSIAQFEIFLSMDMLGFVPWLLLLSFCIWTTLPGRFFTCNCASDTNQKANIYIVYMGGNLQSGLSATSLHVGSKASEVMVYNYMRSFNRFAAKLAKEEMRKILLDVPVTNIH